MAQNLVLLKAWIYRLTGTICRIWLQEVLINLLKGAVLKFFFSGTDSRELDMFKEISSAVTVARPVG